LVDFTNYGCAGCKKLHSTLDELRELRGDISYIVRPIRLPTNPQADIIQSPAPLENLAMAAGLQDKYEEFHAQFMQYPETIIPEEIIEQNAMLYGVDYEQLVKDANGARVQTLLANNNKDMNALSIRTIPSYIIGKNIYSIGEDLPDLKDMLNIIPLEK
jgi:protein-disulfide isomerase